MRELFYKPDKGTRGFKTLHSLNDRLGFLKRDIEKYREDIKGSGRRARSSALLVKLVQSFKFYDDIIDVIGDVDRVKSLFSSVGVGVDSNATKPIPSEFYPNCYDLWQVEEKDTLLELAALTNGLPDYSTLRPVRMLSHPGVVDPYYLPSRSLEWSKPIEKADSFVCLALDIAELMTMYSAWRVQVQEKQEPGEREGAEEFVYSYLYPTLLEDQFNASVVNYLSNELWFAGSPELKLSRLPNGVQQWDKLIYPGYSTLLAGSRGRNKLGVALDAFPILGEEGDTLIDFYPEIDVMDFNAVYFFHVYSRIRYYSLALTLESKERDFGAIKINAKPLLREIKNRKLLPFDKEHFGALRQLVATISTRYSIPYSL